MKKILAFLCTAMICMGLLTACGGGVDYTETNELPRSSFANKYFDAVTIYHNGGNIKSRCAQTVVYDQNTGIMYLILESGYRLGITPIYNTDGTPKIYEGWQATETTEAE